MEGNHSGVIWNWHGHLVTMWSANIPDTVGLSDCQYTCCSPCHFAIHREISQYLPTRAPPTEFYTGAPITTNMLSRYNTERNNES